MPKRIRAHIGGYKMKLLVLNGPNLNFLGVREPAVYGSKGYAELEAELRSWAPGHELKIEQHNSEGAMINALQQSYLDKRDGIIINAGAYTHTSIALHDAIKSIGIPTIEVHLSNVHAREEFRRHSMIAPACAGVITGFGFDSYRLALRYFIEK